MMRLRSDANISTGYTPNTASTTTSVYFSDMLQLAVHFVTAFVIAKIGGRFIFDRHLQVKASAALVTYEMEQHYHRATNGMSFV